MREAKGPPVPIGGRQGGGEWPEPHSVVPCYLLHQNAVKENQAICPKSCSALCSKYVTGLKLEKKKKREKTRDSGRREKERKKTDLPHDFYIVVVRVSAEKINTCVDQVTSSILLLVNTFVSRQG